MQFRRVAFPNKVLSAGKQRGYRIFKEDGTHVDVDAAMAPEAIEKSGVINPVRVLHLGIGMAAVISGNDLMDPKPAVAEPPAAETPAQTAENKPAETPPAPAAPQATKPA